MSAMTGDLQGLTSAQVEERRRLGQGNRAAPPSTRTYAQIVRENVFTFTNNVLYALCLALVLVGRPLDGAVSVGVILTNVVVSVLQEVRAKRTLDRVALLTRPTAVAIRDGRPSDLSPDDLVLGDLLRIGPGDQVVLDGRLVEGRLQVDESLLTGESDLVRKQPGDLLYSGSFCVTGSGHHLVERVGAESLANRITAGARSFRRVLTPLQKQVYLVIRIVLLIVLYLQVLLVLNSLVKLVPLAEAVAQATVLASLVPNGLFLSIAIAYALGAVRILRHGALVQQSNAIESLSAVDVLCLDKTGTLTTNRLRVTELHPLSATEAELKAGLGALAASSTAGNRTVAAIAAAFPAPASRPLAEVPFSPARRWSAVALAGGGLRGVYALGAPDMLRPYLATAEHDLSTIAEQVHVRTRRGLRVLLLARGHTARIEDRGDGSRLPEGMRPLGLVALEDQLRPEARETLQTFRRAGVLPKIISGDDPDTVAALARQAGLDGDLEAVSGPELEAMDDAQLAEAAERAQVFGRVRPQQKERLVTALRRRHYVAMIGDGVNDVLSLKRADLAIAVQSGSQAARSVADIVLTNDSFAALGPALLEGQRILNGMQSILKLFLARITTVALVIVSALVIGVFPIAIRNGSVLTLFTVGIPSVALALWARPGRRRPLDELPRDLALFVLPAAAASSLLGLLVFYGTLLFSAPLSALAAAGQEAAGLSLAQTALITYLVGCGLLLVVFVEPPTPWWSGAAASTGAWRPAILAAGLLAAFVTVSMVPWLRRLFDLQPLDLASSLLAGLAVLAWLFTVRAVWRGKLLERFLGW